MLETRLLAVPLTIAAATILGLAAQRLLGVRLGLVRLLLTGLFALTLLPLITTAVLSPGGEVVDEEAAGWLLVLGGVATLLAAMAFIVVVEAFAPLGSLPHAPAWGAGVRARLRRARRYSRLAVLVVRHVAWPVLRLRRRAFGTDDERLAQYGRIVCAALDRAGPSFIKLGQLAAGQADLLPAAARAELASLQTATTPMPWAEVRHLLEAELGAQAELELTWIDSRPMAAASLGQVHRARHRDDRELVIKVQRPGVRLSFERDLDIAVHVAALVERRTCWGRRIGALRLAEDFRRAAREELDYRVEAANLTTLATSGHLVPLPVDSLTTTRVLTMTRLQGRTLSQCFRDGDLDPDTRARLAHEVVRSLWHQVLVVGHFHADPHAGNVLVTEAGGVAFLDVGTVGRLDTAQRRHLQLMLVGLLHDDPATIAHHLLALCSADDVSDVRELEYLIGRVLVHPLRSTNAAQALAGLVQAATHCGLRVPGEVAAVARTFVTAEGVLRQLTPAFDLVGSSTRAIRDLAASAAVRAGSAAVGSTMVTAAALVDRLERGLARVTPAPARQRAAHPAPPSPAPETAGEGVAQHALVTALASVTGLMSVLLLSAPAGPTIVASTGLHHLIGYYLLCVSGILGLRVLVHVFRGGHATTSHRGPR